MNFYCNEQLGGICSFNFYLLTETDNWPEVLTDENADQITYTAEEFSVNATLKENGLNLSTNQTNNNNGDIWQPNLRATFVTRSAALDQLLDQYQNQPGILKITLLSGFKKIIGSKLEPLYMNYNVNEGIEIDDANASTTLTIKGKIRQRPVYLQ